MGNRTHPISSYLVDPCGFLVDPGDWSEDFARTSALQEDGLAELTLLHWRVIRFIREWFQERNICPPLVRVGRATGLHLRELERLFPQGYVYGACRLAGLGYRDCHDSPPKPGGFAGGTFDEPVLVH